MSELYLRIYSQQVEVAQAVLRKDGREKLQQMHDYYAVQLHKYGIAAQSPPQQGGLLQRIARGFGGSQAQKLQPRVEAYADVLKANAEASARVAEMSKRIASSWATCPTCRGAWWRSLPEGHLENCDGKNSTERQKEIDSKKDGLVTECYPTGAREQELQTILEEQKDIDPIIAPSTIESLAGDTGDAITDIINQSLSVEEVKYTTTGEGIPSPAVALLWQMRSDLWVRLSDFNADVYGAGFEETIYKDEIDLLCYDGHDENSREGHEAVQRAVFNWRQDEEFKKALKIFSTNLRKMPDFESANNFGNLVIEQVFDDCAIHENRATPESYEEVFEENPDERRRMEPPYEVYEKEPASVSVDEFENQENLLGEFLNRKGLY